MGIQHNEKPTNYALLSVPSVSGVRIPLSPPVFTEEFSEQLENGLKFFKALRIASFQFVLPPKPTGQKFGEPEIEAQQENTLVATEKELFSKHTTSLIHEGMLKGARIGFERGRLEA